VEDMADVECKLVECRNCDEAGKGRQQPIIKSAGCWGRVCQCKGFHWKEHCLLLSPVFGCEEGGIGNILLLHVIDGDSFKVEIDFGTCWNTR